MDPVRGRFGQIGESVRLVPPADWGYPSLSDANAVPPHGMSFTIQLPDAGVVVSVKWLPAMSELARRRAVGEIIGFHGGYSGALPGLLPVCEFPGESSLERIHAACHPSWLDFLGGGGLGPDCTEATCPTAQLMTIGCTCGRAKRERAHSQQLRESVRDSLRDSQ
jgi:hypothetical protein